MKDNLIYMAVAAIGGIALGYSQPSLFSFLLLSVYSFFLFVRKRQLFFLCAITTVGFYLYMIYTDSHNRTILSEKMNDFSIRLIAPITIDGDRLKTIVKTKQHENVQLIYVIKTEQEKKQLSMLTLGMVCSVKGTLERPQRSRNPYAFDYQQYLRFQHIHWLLKPHSFSPHHCRNTPRTWYETLLSIRQKGLDDIKQYFPASTVGIVQALVYGERSQMDDSLLEGYQQLGLVHLLAISGSHVTLLVGACFYFLIRFTTRETATILLLILLPVYTVMTGASPSVIRASFMAMIVLFAAYKKIAISPLDVLCLTCMAMLILQPYALFQAGFQLSFIVSFALIVSLPCILQFSASLARLIVTTLIAQVSALPFLLYHFFEFSLFSFPLNIAFVPLYSFIILPLSLLSLGVHYVYAPASSPFVWALERVITISNDCVTFFSSHAPLSIVLGRPSPFLLVCYGIAIVLAFIRLENKRYDGFLYVLIAIFCHAVSPYIDRYGEVVIVDVGQGDCIYIELPHRKGVYLIDTGGMLSFSKEQWQMRQHEWEVGKDVVIPFLKGNGVRHIDKLLITHGDYDHMGAAKSIMNDVPVKQLVIGKGGTRNSLQAELVDVAKEKHIAVKEVERGDSWYVNDFRFYILNPSTQSQETDDNNNSIVLYTKLGGLSWLFTGDLEEKGEEQLMEAFPQLRVNVLKVGHHGSDTSTKEPLLQAIQPDIALISVGKQNRYHHPHPDVIKRLQAHGITIWRTDQNGAIRFLYTKKRGTFTVMLP
ncbi:DNA internalization-related competence protein ComEC/Rec2 [Thermaerobacillus caldiproteolyticus]|uniref:Competence protein ComEC n=1 Tax=Thermaerobacillus caldiproteolyticus TaxID=247480 RepID=A0A7W0BX23_9BACL|nr:DNA internalization-related competence protein ComEC/Rec2 [Anoxybacillus caldiproteolyticus]MBA2873548.1 competence protein ComEC [Anoxybacillus caldiproteolyticus]